MIMKELSGAQSNNLVDSLNTLLSEGKISLHKKGGENYYKLNSEVGNKQLVGDEIIVYECIRTAGNHGIWKTDLRERTGIHQTVLTKVLKALENKKYIKSITNNKTKKMIYLLYELEPSTEITGGPWFDNCELDTEFIEGLCDVILRYINSKASLEFINSLHLPTLLNVYDFIMKSGIVTIPLNESDVAMLVNRLIYDDLVRIYPSSKYYESVDLSVRKSHEIRLLPNYFKLSGFLPKLLNSPCGACPITEDCCDSFLINPSNCEYLAKWNLN